MDGNNRREALLGRLDDIARSAAESGCALAVIGLGSAGLELERLDAYSDLDFFVIARLGCKRRFIDALDWLERVHPVDFAFRNTVDGYKLLFRDGVFCEFAIFEPDELPAIPFAPGRVVWKAEGVDERIAVPARNEPQPAPRDPHWLLGEALTCLYVGMSRYRRGEKLSAQRFIQGIAVDRLVELSPFIENPQPIWQDPFAGERRYEQRYPGLAERMADFIQGYSRSPQSALALLAFLEQHFDVNQAVAARIRALCAGEDVPAA